VIPGLVLSPYVWHTQDFNVLWMLAGLVIATWIHILTDKISSIKTIPKRFKRWVIKKLRSWYYKKRTNRIKRKTPQTIQ
jgi:uncharacterized metal-binding protein